METVKLIIMGLFTLMWVAFVLIVFSMSFGNLLPIAAGFMGFGTTSVQMNVQPENGGARCP